MELQECVMAALRERFGEVTDYLDWVPETQRVLGAVASPSFHRKSHKWRQDRLWETLEASLSPEQLEHLGPIAALAPIDVELGAEVFVR